ncbi:hypothetical protein [Embleya sp. NPDC050493]|uniref:hypothetical protein n=1 Tax=Embleya sp. NPDC050493 TaxID=3363989 RepID=UPI00379B340D
MPTPHGDQGMAFSAHEVRVLRRALAVALRGGRDSVDFWLLGRAIGEAQDERERLRTFMTAELRRYRAALPGTASTFLDCLRNAVDEVAHIPSAEDLAALRSTVDLPCGERERASRIALLHRCTRLAEADLEQRLVARAHRRAAAEADRATRTDPLDILIPTRPRPAAQPRRRAPSAAPPPATPFAAPPLPEAAPTPTTHGDPAALEPARSATAAPETAESETAEYREPAEPEAAESGASEPQRVELEGVELQGVELQGVEPPTVEPQAPEPQAPEPQAPEPQAPEPQAPEPEPAEAGSCPPEPAEREACGPESAARETPDDGAPERATLAPEPAEAECAEPECAEPECAEPECAEAERAEPEPDPAEARAAEPDAAEPEPDAPDPARPSTGPAPTRETLSPVIPHRRQGRPLGQLPAPEILHTGTG